MEELLKELGLSLSGEYDDNDTFTAHIDNSTDIGKVFTILDKKCEEIDDDTDIDDKSQDNLQTTYKYKNYRITLVFDLAEENHMLIITKIADEDEEKEEE